MCDHTGADAPGLKARTAAEPAEHSGDRHPFEVRKAAAEPQMDQSEHDRREHQRRGEASRPLAKPMEQYSAHQEFLRKRPHPKKSEKRTQYFPYRHRVGWTQDPE